MIDEHFSEEIAMAVTEYLFRMKEVFDLLLTKSQGSVYENLVDHMVAKAEEHYTLIHEQIEIFLHLLKHCKDVKEAA